MTSLGYIYEMNPDEIAKSLCERARPTFYETSNPGVANIGVKSFWYNMRSQVRRIV